MLLLGSKTITIEGITVFPDHANPDKFWYLPGPISLARGKSDRRHAFTFIKYKPAAVDGGAKGGGFLMFEVNLRLDSELERQILSKLAAIAPGSPKLAAVPFDEGTVKCVALNLEGSGDTSAPPPEEGTFNAVEKILGASVPSLHGDNAAAFSLTLSQEGATILEQAFEQGTTPVGVIYDLKFTAMRPALNVKITADFKRIYNHFSGSVSGQYYFVQAGIDAGFEKLVQDGVIKIEVTNFTGEADLKEKEDWAKNFFKDKLMSEWFQPTLTPGKLAGGMAQPESLEDVLKRGNQLRPPATPIPPRPDASQPTPAPKPSVPRPTVQTGQGDNAVGVQPHRMAGAAEGGRPTAGTGWPMMLTQIPPVAGAGLGFKSSPMSALSNVGSGPASSASGLPTVALKLKFVRQEELKTLTLEYNSTEATQRTYAPQGFFGLLVADLDRDRHFVEVDLDDPFFRAFMVTADAPIDFRAIGLTSAHIALDYGDASNAANHKHGDFVFDTEDTAEKRFEVFMNEQHDTDYTYQVQYHFDSASGWEGEKFSYDCPVQRTEDRTLLLNPFEALGFQEVRVFPNRIDPGIIESVDVHLRYESPSGWKREKTFMLTPDSEPQFWKLRLTDPTARAYTYAFVYHLKDGSTKETEPVSTQATAIPVDDPFEDALDIEFVPLFDPGQVRMLFIDFEYNDPGNSYKRTERLRLTGDSVDPVKLQISLMDVTKRLFRYRLTFIGTDNQMRRGSFIETEDTLVGIIETQ